jgi:hypothetical protein
MDMVNKYFLFFYIDIFLDLIYFIMQQSMILLMTNTVQLYFWEAYLKQYNHLISSWVFQCW